jgi:hypothetical protein
MGVLPEGGKAVKTGIVSAPYTATKGRSVPPARGQGTDVTAPTSDPQRVH